MKTRTNTLHMQLREEAKWIVDELMPEADPLHDQQIRRSIDRLLKLIPAQDHARARDFLIDLEAGWGLRLTATQDAAFALGYRVASDASTVLFLDGDTGRKFVGLHILEEGEDA